MNIPEEMRIMDKKFKGKQAYIFLMISDKYLLIDFE